MTTVLVDSHVHVYPCFDPARFFDAARANFTRAARSAALPPATPGVLLLTETHVDHFYRRLSDERLALPGWNLAVLEDGNAVRLRNEAGELFVLPGRQIATTERLEVLAVLCNREFPQPCTFAAALAAAAEADAGVIVPWGFGKWTGRRGRIVADTVDHTEPGTLQLGDNGGRWQHGPRPALFGRAEARGIAVLPGSDPLPLSSQFDRAGSYGFVLDSGFDAARPAATLRPVVRGLRPPLRTVGRRTAWAPFLWTQWGIRRRRPTS